MYELGQKSRIETQRKMRNTSHFRVETRQERRDGPRDHSDSHISDSSCCPTTFGDGIDNGIDMLTCCTTDR